MEGDGLETTEACLISFRENFDQAVNVEWFQKEGKFEVIFYKNHIEHLAVFQPGGELLEYQQNLSKEYLPEHIKKLSLRSGEIMNSILRNKGNRLEYEIIVRDPQMMRYLLLISDNGTLLEERKL